MNLRDVYTPALILDRRRLMNNTTAMKARLDGMGITFRPHVKTAKSPEIARIAHGDALGPITVSTLREAEYFFSAGFTDMIYAVSIVSSKLKRLENIRDKGVDLKVLVDNIPTAQVIADREKPHTVLIEIDTGDRRSGISPYCHELLEIARIFYNSSNVTLGGVLTHAGYSYGCRDTDSMGEVAEKERADAVVAADRLRAAGYQSPIVSVGSTPTALYAQDLSGVTEARAGVYMFYDLFQAGIGTCQREDIALSVLASVIGHRRSENILIIDAGALALSKDRSTAKLSYDCGYGLVCATDTGTIFPGLYVTTVHQEHGIVTSNQPIEFEAFPIGSTVRILPNHACMTAAAYNEYFVVDGSADVVSQWPRCNGW